MFRTSFVRYPFLRRYFQIVEIIVTEVKFLN